MSLYGAGYGLYKNVPKFQVGYNIPLDGSIHRAGLKTQTNEYKRRYPMFIAEDDARKDVLNEVVKDEVITTDLTKDTYNRLMRKDSNDVVETFERKTEINKGYNIMGLTPNRRRRIDKHVSKKGGHERYEEPVKQDKVQQGAVNDKVDRMTVDGNVQGNVVKQQPVKHQPVKQPSTATHSPFRSKIHVPTRFSNDIERYTYQNAVTEHDTDDMFMNMLKSRAKMVSEHVMNNKFYMKWYDNWKLLEKNLKRNRYLFNRLDQSDADIAYVINKGDEVNFRIRDEIRYVPINIYQYVLYHEMAHMSTNELQHTPKFHELLNILSFAAFELGLIDVRKTTKEYWNTNGQPILCRAALQDEIIAGAEWLMNVNPGHEEYFQNIIGTVERMGD